MPHSGTGDAKGRTERPASVTRPSRKTDAQLRHDVLRALDCDARVDPAEVAVEVWQGVVTLTGTVSGWTRKLAAAEAAHRVPGVLDVANDLEVGTPDDAPRDDAEIARRVRQALDHAAVSAERIRSTVVHRHVTLDGSVDTESQRVEAERLVRELPGVAGVIDELRVEPARIEPGAVQQAIALALERRAEREAHRIRVTVADATVTLSGTVRSSADKQAAIAAARYARGVRAVEDQLSVVPDP